ncbi:MAG: ketoacyl-ACP synthase III [Lachnospiraceae bacterium]|nr:ketoacyl-ACP synthase III [Lachnospiraceae bacterium]
MAAAVPETRVTTQSYTARFGEEEIKKFIDMVGVQERYISVERQTGSDLCYTAADALLRHKGYEPESIDAVIFIGENSDYKEPATAHVLHKRLKLRNDCFAFDINLGCTAFIYGVSVMSGLIAAGFIKRGLLCVGEVPKYSKDTEDHSNAMMFGDAGSACIIEAGEGELKTLLKSDGSGFNIIGTPGGHARHPLDQSNPDWSSLEPKMDGFETFRFAITKAPAAWKEFMKQYEVSVADFDYFLFHQSNKFMIDHIAHKMKLTKEQYPVSIDRYGNTNGVSIPVTLVDYCTNNAVKDRLNLVCVAFGIGLSWGVIAFEIDSRDILPMIHSDDYYEEAYSLQFGKKEGDE